VSETAFIDAVCPRCKARIGWHGRVIDRPACHRCGHQVPQADLQHDQDEMDNARKVLEELHQAKPGWDKWRKARVMAGLTLRQAAKQLGTDATTLSGIERGQTIPSDELATRMRECYGGFGDVTERAPGRA
jgi:ribosome-binding protein aMBF1 (putative translation factor)